MRSMFAAILVMTSISAGCAKYEYNIVKPPEQSRHIGTSVDAVVMLDPLEYCLRSVDNRLVIRIYNGTPDAVELLGPRSVVVDPDGQSHPVRAQTIASGSYIKLILPPMKPQVYDPYPGPYFGVGVGAYQRVNASPMRADSQHEPRYLDIVVETNDSYYWNWKGEGESRLMLVYSRAGKEFTQEFVFRRQKM